LVSWRDGEIPSTLEGRGRGNLSTSEIEELTPLLYVMSNHCAHLGCPVRYFRDRGEILCPCHGGIYDINGGLIAGPPPQGLYYYAFEIREDGGIYVKHEFTNGKPWVD
jgi:Rieske Fe-S protein